MVWEQGRTAPFAIKAKRYTPERSLEQGRDGKRRIPLVRQYPIYHTRLRHHASHGSRAMALLCQGSKPMPPRNTPEKFWQRVLKTETCWLWQGSTQERYGTVTYQGRKYFTHRLAWILTYGPIQASLHVCHRCDNPPCCNPEHLFLGTHRDNMLDAWDKGRMDNRYVLTGEEIGTAKLTAKDVITIRYFYALGITHQTLARRFNVSQSNINSIVLRQTWQSI